MSRILYLHGFASGPASQKARFFHERFARRGVPLEIPDLAEEGFERLTITGQLEVIRREARGEPVSLIGSSLGGYLAALYAARHPEVVKVVLLAPAFAFRTRWLEWLGEAAVEAWRSSGRLLLYHYGEKELRPVGYQLLEDAQGYDDFPVFGQPALLFHGRMDDVVPVADSERFARENSNVRLQLLDSDHQLLNVLEEIWDLTQGFLSEPQGL